MRIDKQQKRKSLMVVLLGRIVTHFCGVVLVKWVAHHARVISVGLTVKSTGVGHAKVVS